MNAYEERQEARRERLRERATRARAESEAAHNRADSIAGVIPFGQPILVGHHSEKRHRRDLDRIHTAMGRGVEEWQKSKELERRAEAVGKGGISSDDPEAVDKLRAKLAKLEAIQERTKKANRLYRKGGAEAMADAGLIEPHEVGALEARIAAAYSWEKQPFPSWSLKNNNANVRRIRKRIADLEANEARPAEPTIEGDGWQIVDNAAENRVQVVFAAKPPQAVRDLVKRMYGFRWAPSLGVWQRKRTGVNWRYLADNLPAELAKLEG